MYKNFIRTKAANIETDLLDVKKNYEKIIDVLKNSINEKVDLLVFPQLTLTGKTAGDLISNKFILNESLKYLLKIVDFTSKSNLLFNIGLPLKIDNKLLDASAIINKGRILGFLINPNLDPTLLRSFSNIDDDTQVVINKKPYLLSNKLRFKAKLDKEDIIVKYYYEEDFIANNNYSGENISLIIGETESYVGSDRKREINLLSKSLINKNSLVYAGLNNFESSTNNVYSSYKCIIENGQLISKSALYTSYNLINDINLDEFDFKTIKKLTPYQEVYFDIDEEKRTLIRELATSPFIPENQIEWEIKMEEIINLQTEALKRRLSQITDKKIFLGLSGGLDSTLALLLASITYHKMGLNSKDIYAVSMPGLGTSKRTFNNGKMLAESLDVNYKEISIVDASLQHFKDIEHNENNFDITYENSQARERTQILMDLSNKHGGIVLGTGNMSENALGWATYNGDHMSMYAINAGLPKTLLKEVVKYFAINSKESNLQMYKALTDIINTPISPELLPTDSSGNISQITEDNVGPYELHDFFLYHFIKNSSTPENILYMAKHAFKDVYDEEVIRKWLDKFMWRFSTQQFKRSAMPDSPQIESFSLSPRGGLVMASDISPYAFYKKY